MHGCTSGSISQRPPYQSSLNDWYLSERGVTLNGSTVSGWASQGSRAKSVSQGTAANQPTYSASDANLNSRPSVQYDGTNDFTTAATAADWTFLHQGTFSFACAVRIGSLPASFGPVWDTSNGGTQIPGGVLYINSAGSLVFSGWNATVLVYEMFVTTQISANTSYVISGSYDNAASPKAVLRKNGSQIGTSSPAASPVGDAPANAMRMGCRSSAAENPLDVDIAELLFWSRALTSAELLDVERWLGRRRGITVA